MTSYSVSQNQIVTAMFYFFLQYNETALDKISSTLTYALKSISTPKIHDQGACSRLADRLFRCVSKLNIIMDCQGNMEKVDL